MGQMISTSTDLDAETDDNGRRTIDRRKFIGVIGGAIGALAIGSAAAFLRFRKSQPTGANEQNPSSKEHVPAEARDFVGQYGDRYDDPVAVYYSMKAYDADHPEVMLSNSFVADFQENEKLWGENADAGENSILGFAKYRVAISGDNDSNSLMRVFNENAAGNMSRYMNLLAKNPSTDAEAVIDGDFQNYCSSTGQLFGVDDEIIANLMNTAKSIVAEHGSAANYAVASGINEEQYSGGSKNTVFSTFPAMVVSVPYGQGDRTEEIDSKIELNINIDVYDKNNSVTHNNEVISDFDFSMIKQSALGDGSHCYVSIGQIKQ